MRDSEERFRRLVDLSPDAIFIVQWDKFVFVNPAALRLFRASQPEELLGQPILDRVHPYYRPLVRQRMTEGINNSLPASRVEEQYLRLDGSVVDVDVAAEPFLIKQEPASLVIVHDISLRKRAESLLRLQSAALEAADDAIVITDREGIVTWANPAFFTMTGYTPEEILGKNPRVLKSGKHDAAFYQVLWETILAGRVFRSEIVNRRKDGSLSTEQVTITPVRNEQGEVTHFIAIKQEITERKKLENRLLRSQRLESIGCLASGIAHDLNNILAPIVMCAPMLRSELPENERSKLVSMLEASAERAVGVIKQLLTVGRGLEGPKVALEIRHLLRDISKIARETFPRSIRFELNLPNDLWSVCGDATQLHQTFLNFAVNSRDAMPTGGRLVLHAQNIVLDEHFVTLHGARVAGPYVLIQVSDTGLGIPEEIRDKIFEPFFTTKAPGKGTGLGLTTALEIIKAHHGFITLRSAAGEGTTFEIYLPATPGVKALEERARAVQHLPRGTGELILIVDDEHTVCDAVRQTLERHGYEVIHAVDGIEAIAEFSARRTEVRAVVTDIFMPLMDGVTLCRTLKRLSPKTPIIVSTGVVTGQGAIELSKALSELSISAVLQKPHTGDALLEAVHNALDPNAAR